jgi:predicted methyltransferase
MMVGTSAFVSVFRSLAGKGVGFSSYKKRNSMKRNLNVQGRVNSLCSVLVCALVLMSNSVMSAEHSGGCIGTPSTCAVSPNSVMDTPKIQAQALSAAVLSDNRTEAFRQRDSARHPEQTLQFFDVQPQHHVVEIWPGAGWYSEILAPYLMPHGRFYAAHFPQNSPVSYFNKARAKYAEKLAASPELYQAVEVTAFHPSSSVSISPQESVDRVLTFRNVHNWLKGGYAPAAFSEFYRALKPDGILGVVEHRAPAGTSSADMISSGYMTQAAVIALAETAGFKLLASSEINSNVKDNAQHPAGVWSLPPSLRLGESDREKYVAIGESDRMTLKFIKPSHSAAQ